MGNKTFLLSFDIHFFIYRTVEYYKMVKQGRKWSVILIKRRIKTDLNGSTRK